MNGFDILLVASNSQYCQDARVFLARYNYKLTIAKNDRIALSLLERGSFDVVVCCVDATSNGFKILQQLQTERQFLKVPFILLGERYDAQQHRQAMAMGADDILFLPYSLSDLQTAIAIKLRKNQALLQDSQQELQQLRHNITTYLPHEMRTALTGIMTASELLFRQEHLEPQLVREMLRCINVSGQRLSHLIQNFLLYSTLQTIATDSVIINKLQKKRTFEVESAIARVIAKYGKKYSRQTDFILNLEQASVQMSSDCLNKLIAELVDNACKFSPCGTPIEVSSKITDNCLVIAIANKGRGMTPEQIASIGWGIQFDRMMYEQQGFGLGLIISQNIAQLHGGTLAIESILNLKTNVKVSLPIAASNY